MVIQYAVYLNIIIAILQCLLQGRYSLLHMQVPIKFLYFYTSGKFQKAFIVFIAAVICNVVGSVSEKNNVCLFRMQAKLCDIINQKKQISIFSNMKTTHLTCVCLHSFSPTLNRCTSNGVGLQTSKCAIICLYILCLKLSLFF